MKLRLKEPLLTNHLHLSADNIIHILMPVVSGTAIGLDNTCKAVYSLQAFFDKGFHTNKKTTLKKELLAYKDALESDLSLLRIMSPPTLTLKKQERLAQINTYLTITTHLEKHPELDCLNHAFPSYPTALYALIEARNTSNLYSMILHPTDEDRYLRLEATNPVFSVAHKSVARQIEYAISSLQQALINAYTPLIYETRDLKSQLIQQVLTQGMFYTLPVDFEQLRDILQQTINTQLTIVVDFTHTLQGAPINQQNIDQDLDFNPATTTPKEYINALLGYCAPHLFDTTVESPFNTLTHAETWSIATQFLLGITNIYCVSQGKTSPNTNFGYLLDNNLDLSNKLARTLAQAQQNQDSIESVCLSWVNTHALELNLMAALTTVDCNAIKENFAILYAEIKDSPHFDEFFVLDRQKIGDFITHKGSICINFVKFASSPLFQLDKELDQFLKTVRCSDSILNTAILHKNSLIEENLTLDTTTMDYNTLHALYEQINTYDDLTLKEQWITELKQERPDFKAHLDAKQFLQHIAYGEQMEAECCLKKNPTTVDALLTVDNIAFTDYSNRTFTCTGYEYAYWAKDTYMCRMLENYMTNETKQKLLKRVNKIEALIGPDFFKVPRGLAYTQNKTECRSAHFDLTPLRIALKTYIDEFNQIPMKTTIDWGALNTLWIRVGLFQREVPAHIAQEYCNYKRQGIEKSNNPLLSNTLNDNSSKRQLTFYNWVTNTYDSWFNHDLSSENSGLGISFTALSGSRITRGLGRSAQQLCATGITTDLLTLEAIDKARTEDLKQSIVNLATMIISPIYQPQST